MRFFEAPNGYEEPTIWVDLEGCPDPIFARCDLPWDARKYWPHIVRALTAGPTIESARVVIDVLNAENRELDALSVQQSTEIAELRRANDDLNRELTDLRRANQ